MQNQPYDNFWQRIHQSAKVKGFPVRVMFELTYRCNFKCKHCYVPHEYQRSYGELKTKEIFAILEQLKEAGCFYLGFTGGEPFMRKDALDIFRYAKKCGFEIIIYSNGSLIDAKTARVLGELRPNKVDITIPAMTKLAFENITGLAGSHAKVFKAIKLLRKNNVVLGFKSCVLKGNESEIVRIQKFAGSLGALHRLDDMLSPALDGSKEPFRFRGILEGDERMEPESVAEAPDICLPKAGRSRVAKELFRCGVGMSQAAITPKGELKMCLMIDYPKYMIRDSSFKKSWEKMKGVVKKITPDDDYQCDKCSLEVYCKWCPGKSWLETRQFTACDPESRRYAQLMKNRMALK